MSDVCRDHILRHPCPNGQTDFDAARLGQVCARVTRTTGAAVMRMADLPQRLDSAPPTR